MAQIQFKGKIFVQNHHLLVKYHELIPVKGKSLTDKVSLHDNLIIHGDNHHHPTISQCSPYEFRCKRGLALNLLRNMEVRKGEERSNAKVRIFYPRDFGRRCWWPGLVADGFLSKQIKPLFIRLMGSMSAFQMTSLRVRIDFGNLCEA